MCRVNNLQIGLEDLIWQFKALTIIRITIPFQHD